MPNIYSWIQKYSHMSFLFEQMIADVKSLNTSDIFFFLLISPKSYNHSNESALRPLISVREPAVAIERAKIRRIFYWRTSEGWWKIDEWGFSFEYLIYRKNKSIMNLLEQNNIWMGLATLNSSKFTSMDKGNRILTSEFFLKVYLRRRKSQIYHDLHILIVRVREDHGISVFPWSHLTDIHMRINIIVNTVFD